MKHPFSTCLILLLLLNHCINGQSLSPNKFSYLDEVKTGAHLSDSSLLITHKGDTTYFSDLKGEWLFLDYWSSTCIPCIKEMPMIKKLNNDYKQKGLRVVMINLDKKEKTWKRGIQSYDLPAPHFRTDRKIQNHFFTLNLVQVLDDDGKSALSTLMPQYVLISPTGKIINKKMPKPSDTNFDQILKNYLNL